MEKEKKDNSTEIGKKPSLQERNIIFAQNLYHKIEIQSPNFKTEGKIDVFTSTIKQVHDNGIIVGKNEHVEVEMEYCRLLKKPLEKISAEDAIQLCEKCNFVEALCTYKNGQLIAKAFIGDQLVYAKLFNDPTFIEAQQAIDFLRERGYALPYGPWSVDQLAEFGIYKLIKE